jgi:1-acyl-sn-glycerol-3-phosphate acyltransferase
MKGGLIIASNHQSYLDPFFIGTVVDREPYFLARSDLFSIPIFRGLIRALHAIPIRRQGPDLKAIREVLRLLNMGKVVVVFPEGTRTPDGCIGRVKDGLTMIAVKGRVPILPVLIQGAFRVWPRTKLLPSLGKVNIIFGYPMDVDVMRDAETLKRAWEALGSPTGKLPTQNLRSISNG